MHAARDVKPITYLKSSTAEAVREVSEEGRTLLITQNGEAKAVLMDVATYDRWRGAMALLKMLSLSELDVRGGRLLATDEALQRFDRALNAADR
jgi:prevent-host-death family protein